MQSGGIWFEIDIVWHKKILIKLHFIRKVWNNTNPPPKKKIRQESRMCFRNMRKFFLNCVRSSGTYPHIKCDLTEIQFLSHREHTAAALWDQSVIAFRWTSSGEKALRCQLDRRLEGSHSRFGRCREEINLLLLLGIEPRFLGRPARSPFLYDWAIPDPSISLAVVITFAESSRGELQ
jgi:hypothetical protein